MKKIFTLLLLLLSFTTLSNAQNLQIHYDFGSLMYNDFKDRPQVTTTVEMFKADGWGSTFFFVDLDYNKKGICSAYWEISRELKFWKPPFSVHIEYNGGVPYIKHSYLVGGTYTWHNQDFSRLFTITPMYKILQGNEFKQYHGFQLTGTWQIHAFDRKLSFTGFIDFWREKHTDIDGNVHTLTMLTEPQLWLNLYRLKGVNPKLKLSVGTEWEISTNFALFNGWRFNPTLAVKWDFD